MKNLNFVDNSTINFTGLCNTKSFDMGTEKMFSEIVITDFIIFPSNNTSSIKEINEVNAKFTLLDYKVIDFPAELSSGYVENYGKKRITGKKISASGVICLDITYTAEDDTSSNQIFQGKLPFTCYITVSNETSLSDKFDIYCCIQNVNIISIQNFTIHVSVNFTISAKKNSNSILIIPNNCFCSTSTSLITIGVSSKDSLHKLIKQSDKVWNEISFSRNLILPSNLPNAKTVTSISSKVKIISQKIIDSPPTIPPATNFYGENLLGKKLVIEAMLKQQITYISEDLKSTSHSLIINLPVSCYMIIPNETNLNQKFKIDSYIEYLYSCCINQRTLFSGAILFFKANQENCVNIDNNNFNVEYKIKNPCNPKKIPLFTIRGTWSKSTFYKRVDLDLNNPINFIKSASLNLKIISKELVYTPQLSYGNSSYEGFFLTGLLCVVNGYALINVTYNSSNFFGRFLNKEIFVPFSAFVVLHEEPTANDKLVIMPCIENFFTVILDKVGIGVYIQLFLKANIVPIN